MGKAEVGTPKWLSNKMKAKGLQRLRWYCQMCEKQCRDENGFKCHCLSEAHQRQMAVFAQRSGRYISDFSREFEASFMQLVSTRYCRTKVLANTVYQDLISNKDHVHMNSTAWATLTEFVYHLERTGRVTVEPSEMGPVIEYIDKEKLLREQKVAAMQRAEVDTAERRQRELNRRVAEAWAAAAAEPLPQTTAPPQPPTTAPASASASPAPIAFSISKTAKGAAGAAGAEAAGAATTGAGFTNPLARTAAAGAGPRPAAAGARPAPRTAVERLAAEGLPPLLPRRGRGGAFPPPSVAGGG